MSLRAEGEAILSLSFSLLRRSAPRNDFYAPRKGGGVGYVRGASPLFLLYIRLSLTLPSCYCAFRGILKSYTQFSQFSPYFIGKLELLGPTQVVTKIY